MVRLVMGTALLAGVGGVVMADEQKVEDKKTAVATALETFTGTWEIVAVKPDGTSAQAIAQSNDFLASRAVAGGSVKIVPGEVKNLPPGTHIKITASAACDANTLIPTLFYGGKTISADCTMVKE